MATTRVVPILFDCTDKAAYTDIKQKYGVSGLPAVVYVDPEGKKLKEIIGQNDAPAYLGAIDSVAKKLPGRPTFWNNTVKSAATAAFAAKKPVAVYIAKEGADPLKVTAALNKNLGDRKAKLLWTWETGTAKVLELRAVESAPAVVLYEAADKDGSITLLGKVTVKEGEDPKLMNAAIDEILKNAKK